MYDLAKHCRKNVFHGWKQSKKALLKVVSLYLNIIMKLLNCIHCKNKRVNYLMNNASMITPSACTRGKVIGLSVCRRCCCYCHCVVKLSEKLINNSSLFLSVKQGPRTLEIMIVDWPCLLTTSICCISLRLWHIGMSCSARGMCSREL